MPNPNYFLPGFHLQSLRRTPRSAQQRMAEKLAELRRHSLTQLSDLFGHFIVLPSPDQRQQSHRATTFVRRRILSLENTFWAFFSQILDSDGSCAAVVRQLQAHAAATNTPTPSSSSSAYCQARAKLDERLLVDVLANTAQQLQAKGQPYRWHKRRVVVVDGTGLSMPDTAENQREWPQSARQQPGCGFPSARLCACFCLASGGLLSYRLGNKKSHELPLLQQQWSSFKPGDVLLADKGFCSFYDVYHLQQRAVDSVVTLARRTPVNASQAVKVLGKDDLLIHWPRPVPSINARYSKAEAAELPEQLLLRQVKVNIEVPGFRTRSYYLVTTLLDRERYSAEVLADLYRQRWQVELFFRDLKTTLDMDVLRCRAPAMIRKEILMHFIVYNAVRALMLKSVEHTRLSPHDISFKASVQAFRHWLPLLANLQHSRAKIRALINVLYQVIADALLFKRPNRSEPRCVKRRPKTYALMTRPRHEMIPYPHRGRHRAKAA